VMCKCDANELNDVLIGNVVMRSNSTLRLVSGASIVVGGKKLMSESEATELNWSR
jgi:hypothetical protein